MNAPRKKSPDADDVAKGLIQRLAAGNPLLDDEAYQRAYRTCKSDAERDLLEAVRDAAREAIANHGTGSAAGTAPKGAQKDTGAR